MSIGPMSGVLGSAAGAPLSQTSDKERATKDASATERQVTNDTKAEKAAGIGQTESDEGPSERDADGRKLWEDATEAGQKQEPPAPEAEPPRQVKDPKGESGSSLDLTG